MIAFQARNKVLLRVFTGPQRNHLNVDLSFLTLRALVPPVIFSILALQLIFVVSAAGFHLEAPLEVSLRTHLLTRQIFRVKGSNLEWGQSGIEEAVPQIGVLRVSQVGEDRTDLVRVIVLGCAF